MKTGGSIFLNFAFLNKSTGSDHKNIMVKFIPNCNKILQVQYKKMIACNFVDACNAVNMMFIVNRLFVFGDHSRFVETASPHGYE
ncbi:hypothetical protein T01_12353 [Trichinella spiralis]|uniref:Uncharacterized protein n=1 Tax=Trichinella spiralis TaxID=6334 RepID=A0A0V1BKA1_TRISP|nr:hypothetical protein T01_12353 [Trichinella spiralis]